jgi:hypothetical protein
VGADAAGVNRLRVKAPDAAREDDLGGHKG